MPKRILSNKSKVAVVLLMANEIVVVIVVRELHYLYRGYYTVAQWYELYFGVVKNRFTSERMANWGKPKEKYTFNLNFVSTQT